MAKRKTLEERLASYREEAENNSKQLGEPEVSAAEKELIPPAGGWPKVADPEKKECCDQKECCKSDRLLPLASLIIQGIYSHAGVPRRKQDVNKDAWDYLTGENMDKAMSLRAEYAIQQAKILLEKL